MDSVPVHAPDFRIQIDGRDIPVALRASIASVSYQDGISASDRVEIGVANPSLRWLQSHIRGLGFSPCPTRVQVVGSNVAQAAPSGIFDIDNRLTLALGYAPGPLADVFQGEITGIQASFPTGGMPALTIVAHDALNRLARGTGARGFGALPDVLIAAILSVENQLIPLIDPVIMSTSIGMASINAAFKGTGTKQAAAGRGESSLEVIKRIAATYDADFWVDGDTLHLSRFDKSLEPALTVTWGESLLDFSPQVSVIGQVAGVSMKFTLREISISFLVSVFWDFDRETLGIEVTPSGAATPRTSGGPRLSIIDQPISCPADIASSALVIIRQLRAKLNSRMTGRGTSIGNPKLRAGQLIRLDGLGPDFSGNYRVKSATHTVDSGGYQTHFEVFKEIIP